MKRSIFGAVALAAVALMVVAGRARHHGCIGVPATASRQTRPDGFDTGGTITRQANGYASTRGLRRQHRRSASGSFTPGWIEGRASRSHPGRGDGAALARTRTGADLDDVHLERPVHDAGGHLP